MGSDAYKRWMHSEAGRKALAARKTQESPPLAPIREKAYAESYDYAWEEGAGTADDEANLVEHGDEDEVAMRHAQQSGAAPPHIPQKRTCRRCGVQGHAQTNCPHLSAEERAAMKEKNRRANEKTKEKKAAAAAAAGA